MACEHGDCVTPAGCFGRDHRIVTLHYPSNATAAITAHPTWVPSGYPDVLPVHETAVCPQCGSAGVTLRGEQADCHACDYRWRWPLAAIDIGLD